MRFCTFSPPAAARAADDRSRTMSKPKKPTIEVQGADVTILSKLKCFGNDLNSILGELNLVLVA